MMKYKGSKFAELQSECFAKSSISLMGALGFRRLWLEEKIKGSSVFGDGPSAVEFECRHVNMISDDAHQDWYKFACDAFATLAEFKAKFPDLTDVCLFIDGAANLTGIGVVFVLLYAEEYTGLRVRSIDRCE